MKTICEILILFTGYIFGGSIIVYFMNDNFIAGFSFTLLWTAIWCRYIVKEPK